MYTKPGGWAAARSEERALECDLASYFGEKSQSAVSLRRPIFRRSQQLFDGRGYSCNPAECNTAVNSICKKVALEGDIGIKHRRRNIVAEPILPFELLFG